MRLVYIDLTWTKYYKNIFKKVIDGDHWSIMKEAYKASSIPYVGQHNLV